MAEQLTVNRPNLDDIGLTEEGKARLIRYFEVLEEQLNQAILDHEQRITALE